MGTSVVLPSDANDIDSLRLGMSYISFLDIDLEDIRIVRGAP